MHHRRKYLNAQIAGRGELTSGAAGFISPGSKRGVWFGHRNGARAFEDGSEEDLHPGIVFQYALPPSFLEERHQAPVPSRDEGPHELDDGVGRLYTRQFPSSVENRSPDD
jgi:hypothetical protein